MDTLLFLSIRDQLEFYIYFLFLKVLQKNVSKQKKNVYQLNLEYQDSSDSFRNIKLDCPFKVLYCAYFLSWYFLSH